MKKLLSILGAVTLIGTASISVIACGSCKHKSKVQKVDISNKIADDLYLGQLSANTKKKFINNLQSKLIIIAALNTITTADYDVYQAGTTDDIQATDINAGTSLAIKIVAKGNNFTGMKDNIIINYAKKNQQKQDTIYLDENKRQQRTRDIDLSNKNITEIIQIGFYKNSNGKIQAVKMPKTITKVTNELPSEITNISFMFSNAIAFNQNLAKWDTSHVINMKGMFAGASAFNQDISTWNVANVTDMSYMFSNAINFNQDLSKWNTSNVINMSFMFNNAKAFNQEIASWNVANVTDMSSMFSRASAFNQNLTSWNVANVTTMSYMFAYASDFNQDISTWNVANVIDMNHMFYKAKAFNQEIANWNVANVTKMQVLFSGASSFNQDISTWNVVNVTDMSYMFYNAINFNQDLSKWNTSNVIDMSFMFVGALAFYQDLSKWNVAKVTNYFNFADNSGVAKDVSKWPRFR